LAYTFEEVLILSNNHTIEPKVCTCGVGCGKLGSRISTPEVIVNYIAKDEPA
jgi:hypothetical protein